MAKEKFYAVKKGKVPGIYKTWDSAKEQVSGFSGAEYKSFTTEEDAKNYLAVESQEVVKEEVDPEAINNKVLNEIENINSDQAIAFVDGSYSPNVDGREKYGFGVILIAKDMDDLPLSKSFVDRKYMSSRNVAGEIEGVKEAILWAIGNEKKEIKIFYDYEGIEKWALKEWNANKDVSQDYVKFCDEKSKLIKISFEHVKAHSGIDYNERVDELAKMSLRANNSKTYTDGSIMFYGLGLEFWVNIIDQLNQNVEIFDDKDEIKKNIKSIKDGVDKIEVTLDKDKVTIQCYGRFRSYVQGKQSNLFQTLVSYGLENLANSAAVIDTLKEYHVIDIEKEAIEDELRRIVVNLPAEVQDIKLYNLLITAIINRELNYSSPDYTHLIHPVCRISEYCLHRVLGDKMNLMTEKTNGSNNFSFFDKDAATGKYSCNVSSHNLNNDQEKFLNDLYNFYNRVRHPYSHWSRDSIDTQVITDIEVARDHILDGLELVDRYYELF